MIIYGRNSVREALNSETEISTIYIRQGIRGAENQAVIDLIKKIAIDLKLPDTRKRDMILLKTGFSVDNAIRVNEVLDVEDTAPTEEKEVKRKSTPITKEPAPTRKYNVVSQQ